MKLLRITALMFAAGLLLVSCGQQKTETVIAEKSVPITISTIETLDLKIENIYTGTLQGSKEAKVFASLPEAVVETPVKAGNYVKAGTPVIKLNKGGASSQYNQALAVYNQAKDNYNKFKNMFEQGAVSEQSYISAKTNFEVAEANFNSARQQVELTSPISGILTDLAVNIGEYVPLGIPLATISQTNNMRLKIFVGAKSAGNIKVGQMAEVNVEILGLNSSGLKGKVIAVSKSADPATRLFQVEIQIANPDGNLKPGMFARAGIKVADLKGATAVSKEAIFTDDGIFKVYKVVGDRAKEISISVGPATDDYYQVLDGLTPADSVVMIGRNLIEDGSLIKITDLNNENDSTSEEVTEVSSEG